MNVQVRGDYAVRAVAADRQDGDGMSTLNYSWPTRADRQEQTMKQTLKSTLVRGVVSAATVVTLASVVGAGVKWW